MKYSLQHIRNIAPLLLFSVLLSFAGCNEGGAGPTPTTGLVIRNPEQQQRKIADGFHIGSKPYDNIYDSCYGGAYINEDDVLVVLLTENTEENRERACTFANASNILFEDCEFSLTELHKTKDTLYDNYHTLQEQYIRLHRAVVDEEQNRVVATIQNYTEENMDYIRSLVSNDCIAFEDATAGEDGWLAKLIREGRVELSHDAIKDRTSEAYFAAPVQVTKSVQLGDFIYTMTAPKTLFHLSDLQNGTEVIEITTTLTYVGELDSIQISSYDSPFYAGSIGDLHGNYEGGGSYSIGAYHTLIKDEPISFTKTYNLYSRLVTGTGPGVIMAYVEFTVLDENEEDTEESYDYALAIPYEVLE